MTRQSMLSLSAIAAVFVLGAAYLAFGVLRVDWARGYIHVTATMPNSGGLLPRSPVLLSGVEVGDITGVDSVSGAVRVRMRIADSYRVPADSTVRIEALSALGEPYLLFTPNGAGAGAYLTDGALITAQQVRAPLSIPDMAAAAADLLAQFDPQTVTDLVRTATEATARAETSLPQLNRGATLLAATLLAKQPQLRTILTEMQRIGSDLDWLEPALDEGGPQWGRFGGRVREVVDALERLMRSDGFPDAYLTDTGLVPFLDQLSTRLDRIGPDLQPLIPVLTPMVSAGTGVAAGIDVSALITQALGATDPGAVRLHITVR
ncbi:MlaD family protein [Nocardia brasiliensis]|uniref:MlaD family protein n=1 Tax=Nocardia brasiliensis TaxID=37326 RepID=UPI0004A70A15|nr:MlaD family protein [Nocardia brasiliensis]